jgi:hypothetical protein
MSEDPEHTRPVLPDVTTEAEAAHDSLITRWLIYAMIILAAAGLFALLYGGLPSNAQTLVFFVVLIAVIVAVAMSAPRRRSVWQDDGFESEYALPQGTPESSRVLDYERPVHAHSTRKVAGGILLFICGAVIGLFSVVGVTVATGNPAYGIGGPVAVGLLLLALRGIRSFAIGLIFSPALLFLIIFAICGGFR